MQLPSFPLVKWFAAAESRFDVSLSHSDCEPLTVAELLDKHQRDALINHRLAYGTFAGLETLREVVARQYATIDKDDVLVFSGASEAIYTFMRTTLSPGDEVVIQSPIFNALRGTASAIGCQLVEWRPTDEAACSFDADALIGLCSEQTRLIIFNFPHNPSGQVIAEADLRRIVETARRCNAYVFSDEQFRLLELGSTPALPAACDLYDKAVSVTGVSKTHGLGGLRIGWLATRCRDVIERAREYRYYTTEMTNTPCQLMAAAALAQTGKILESNRTRIAANVQRLRAFAEQHHEQLGLHPPQAGTMALVAQKTSLTSRQLCERLLDEQRVFLIPGEAMGMSDRLLRFGFGRDDFGTGLDGLGRLLRNVQS